MTFALPRRGLLLAALTAAACGLPTDQSGDLSLEIVGGFDQMLVGDTGRLAVRVGGGAGASATLDVRFTSSDEEVLVADPSGLLVAVGEGKATVTASLLQYANATTASQDIYVSRGVVIAEVQGASSRDGGLRFSETAIIRGRRLDPDSLASVTIGSVPAEVVGYEPAGEDGLETLRVIVPIVPANADLLIVHLGGGSGSRPLTVVQADVFELFAAPFTVDLGSGGFRVTHATVGWPDYDWYRFELPAGDWTFEVALKNGFVFHTWTTEYRMELRAPTDFPEDGFPAWGRAQNSWSCRQPGDFQALSRMPLLDGLARLTLPVRTATPLTLDFVGSTEWGFLVPYSLTVTPGYVSALLPDETEGNDFCTQAARLELDAARTVNFDTPADHDWYEIVIPGPPTVFGTVPREEVEPNNSRATAELVTSGTRVTGRRATEGDQDFFAIDLQPGQLLAVDVRSYLVRPEQCPASACEMVPDIAVYDSLGTEVARGGIAFSVPRELRNRGTEGFIRYSPTEAGRYYIRIIGESVDAFLPDYGDFMWYAMDVWTRDLAGTVSVNVNATDGGIDPEIILIERRSSENYPLDATDTEGGTESVTFPASPGRYYLLLWNARATTGSYEITPTFSPYAGPAPVSR